jgi:hypothetical protein
MMQNDDAGGRLMAERTIHQCQCPDCQQAGNHPNQKLHYQMNLLLSRLDEQQQRWYVALEANKLGHGGVKRMSQITGLHVQTIRRGQRELDSALADRPVARVRLPGGGRLRVEKKIPAWQRC